MDQGKNISFVIINLSSTTTILINNNIINNLQFIFFTKNIVSNLHNYIVSSQTLDKLPL